MYRIKELLLLLILGMSACNARTAYDIQALQSPVIFQGDSVTAFRDPAVVYNDNQVYLFFTLVEIEGDGRVFSYTAQSKSSDLIHWSSPEKITPRDQDLNYCSPGNVVRFQDEWVLCLQTYPRPDHTIDQGTRYGTRDARIFIMRSGDLKHWSEPEILMVKGPGVPVKGMGRMIDPYLVEDVHEEGKWWCFYKQNGASMSYSYDLKKWTYFGNTQAGENVTVLAEEEEYIMFHSPSNGIGIKRSKDLRHWEDWGPLITLGQENWNWARGRITAATVVDLRRVTGIGRYLMFFHGSGPRTEQEGDFDRNASIGIAWSDDLLHWSWPGKSDT